MSLRGLGGDGDSARVDERDIMGQKVLAEEEGVLAAPGEAGQFPVFFVVEDVEAGGHPHDHPGNVAYLKGAAGLGPGLEGECAALYGEFALVHSEGLGNGVSRGQGPAGGQVEGGAGAAYPGQAAGIGVPGGVHIFEKAGPAEAGEEKGTQDQGEGGQRGTAKEMDRRAGEGEENIAGGEREGPPGLLENGEGEKKGKGQKLGQGNGSPNGPPGEEHGAVAPEKAVALAGGPAGEDHVEQDGEIPRVTGEEEDEKVGDKGGQEGTPKSAQSAQEAAALWGGLGYGSFRVGHEFGLPQRL